MEKGIVLNPAVQVALAAAIAFIMLSIALGLKTRDFAFIRSHPASILIGITTQLLGLPIMTLALVSALDPNPEVALGMLVVACCPGGNTSNLLTRLGHGDTAYSVSLTMVSSIFAATLLPVTILFWTGIYTPTSELLDTVDIDRVAFVTTTSMTLLFPLLIGLLVSHKAPEQAQKMHKLFMPLSVVILLGVIIAGISSNFDMLVNHAHSIFPLVITHNGLGFILGAVAGLLFLKKGPKVRALSFEVGIQNSGLGMLIVLAHLEGVGGAAVVVGAWGIWHLIAGFLIVAGLRFKDSISSNKSEVSHGL